MDEVDNCEETSLQRYVPASYLAILHGTLLATGDVKARGFWRLRQDDKVKSEFCMVLEDRGVYNGGFNVRTPSQDPQKPFIEEVHDKWDQVDWCRTTKDVCNIWGRGRNPKFGAYCLVGWHDPRRRMIMLYKVEEDELMRAMLFAGHTCGNPDTAIGRSSTQFGGREVAGVKQLLSESVIGVEAAVVNHPNEIEPSGPCVHQESVLYGRDCSPIETKDATMVQDTSFQDKDASHGHVLREGWQTALVAEAKEGCAAADTESGPSNLIPPGTTETGRTLPTRESHEHQGVYAAFMAHFESEKAKIIRDATSHQDSLEQAKVRVEAQVAQAKEEEKSLLEAMQNVRHRIHAGERELEEIHTYLKCAELAREGALKWWDDKWKCYMVPYVAQHAEGFTSITEMGRGTGRETDGGEYELPHPPQV